MRPLTLLSAAFLALLLVACGGDETPQASLTATGTPAATATPDPNLIDLSNAVRDEVAAASWYADGAYASTGRNLLEVIATAGALWRDPDSLALLDAYPHGMPDETLNRARTYARMTLNSLHEVILDDWLVDGIDDYERAVLTEAESRTISVAALRRALADGFFRGTYKANPALITSVRIDAIGSLSPHILERLEAEDWFSDGIDSYEASLLGILNTLLTVEEQLEILESANYRPLPLSDASIAVVYLGDDRERIEQIHAVAAAWMPAIEAFVGPFRPIGLVIDTTVVRDAEACHTGDGGGTRPGRIALPADFCTQSPVLIHELAHAFIGGRYPTWFAEGVAEVVAYHLTGTRAGYEGGEGTLQVEGRYFLLSNQYRNQAALGTDFLESLYGVAGEDEMSAFITAVAGRSLSGEDLLARVREMAVEDAQSVENLIADSFGLTLASP